jgi:hypothetical protein
MSASVEELAALRAEVNALKATRLTPEQLAAVDRLIDHVAALEIIVDEHKMRRMLVASMRSWTVGLAAMIGALWAVKEGLARLLRGLLE